MASLKSIYPWTKVPLLVSAPMLGAATPRLAANVSQSGAMGFLAGGRNPDALDEMLSETAALLASSSTTSIKMPAGRLPIGVGFQLFNSPLDALAEVIAKHKPAAVWLFAPQDEQDFQRWSHRVRAVTDSQTAIWIQVGSVGEAKRSLALAKPDVLIAQGNDAGGHGNRQSASIVSLVPEMLDMLKCSGSPNLPVLAAGGIVDSRGFAAALTLGASGVVMGSRFLVAEESGITAGWKRELLRAEDGGMSTLRSTLGDRLKETTGWPSQYDGRAIRNKGHTDEEAGLSDADNISMYKEELQQGDDAWGPGGRMVAWAGTGVGLIEQIQSAGSIVDEVLRETPNLLRHTATLVSDERNETKL